MFQILADTSTSPNWPVWDAWNWLPFKLGPNDGAFRREDTEETGDNEARPTEKETGKREDLDGLEVMEANDGRLGLTNAGDTPADDWAADSGETAVPDVEE